MQLRTSKNLEHKGDTYRFKNPFPEIKEKKVYRMIMMFWYKSTPYMHPQDILPWLAKEPFGAMDVW